MCNADRTLCNSTAALVGPSSAVVAVKNTGTLPAWFSHTLDNCSHPVVPVAPEILALDHNVTTELLFEVRPPLSLPLSHNFRLQWPLVDAKYWRLCTFNVCAPSNRAASLAVLAL